MAIIVILVLVFNWLRLFDNLLIENNSNINRLMYCQYG